MRKSLRQYMSNQCEDCGGIHQRNENDISRHYDRPTDTILHLCIHCECNRVCPTDPEDSVMYRYGQH